MSKGGLTEPRLGDRFESTRDDTENEHVLKVLSTALGNEEGTPEEDLIISLARSGNLA